MARFKSGGSEELEGSIRAWCREKGWNERTFHRRKDWACALIAADLNRLADETMAALLALGQSAPEVSDAVDAA